MCMEICKQEQGSLLLQTPDDKLINRWGPEATSLGWGPATGLLHSATCFLFPDSTLLAGQRCIKG
jgi:hypothetical protein